jgi:uncharacterized YigZ family protein
MKGSFKTILKQSEGIYKEKGSKFLSFAIPVHDTIEIRQIVADFKKKYYDARHICYAYVIGNERNNYRSNDDGEPSGTAGRPILGQLNSHNLTNVLVIVVRYFGGVLLGTGGLTTAYRAAASDALNNAEIVEETINQTLTIQFNYMILNDVMKIIKDGNCTILDQKFEENCSIQFSVPVNNLNILQSILSKIHGLTFEEI